MGDAVQAAAVTTFILLLLGHFTLTVAYFNLIPQKT